MLNMNISVIHWHRTSTVLVLTYTAQRACCICLQGSQDRMAHCEQSRHLRQLFSQFLPGSNERPYTYVNRQIVSKRDSADAVESVKLRVLAQVVGLSNKNCPEDCPLRTVVPGYLRGLR